MNYERIYQCLSSLRRQAEYKASVDYLTEPRNEKHYSQRKNDEKDLLIEKLRKELEEKQTIIDEFEKKASEAFQNQTAGNDLSLEERKKTISYRKDDFWADMLPAEEEVLRDFIYKDMGVVNFDSLEYTQRVRIFEAAKKMCNENSKRALKDLPAVVGVGQIAEWAANLPANQNNAALVIKSMIIDIFGDTKISPETKLIISKLGMKETNAHIDQFVGINNGEVKH